jgi:hypothetical protein
MAIKKKSLKVLGGMDRPKLGKYPCPSQALKNGKAKRATKR